MNDGEFERMLLQSARADAPAGDARDAWVRFSGTLGAIGSGPLPGGHPTALIERIGAGSARAAAMKWLLWGAIGGSAATAAIMLRGRSGETSAPPTVVLPQPMAPAKVAGTPLPAIAPGVDSTAVAPPALAALSARPRSTGRGHARARQDLTDRESSQSTLAAEVSRIDAARTANAAGDYDEAVWLIGRYHRDFPDGALAPDADVVALEAVAAKRDRAETVRRAALFLSRYPGDPHAAKVKRLAEHLGSEQP